jgi:hypothetical protein
MMKKWLFKPIIMDPIPRTLHAIPVGAKPDRSIGDSVYRKSKRRMTEEPKNRMAIDEWIQDVGTGMTQ